ncbi:MAG TPA: hypothetical protein VJ836_07510 [Candidatus Saccharimonadales bacterium]|nr:hypothetical protein [Candidatus Saccharimonadales bacterium]
MKKQNAQAGFTDIGMVAILAALCVTIIAGIIVWQRANADHRKQIQHCTETACMVQ